MLNNKLRLAFEAFRVSCLLRQEICKLALSGALPSPNRVKRIDELVSTLQLLEKLTYNASSTPFTLSALTRGPHSGSSTSQLQPPTMDTVDVSDNVNYLGIFEQTKFNLLSTRRHKGTKPPHRAARSYLVATFTANTLSSAGNIYEPAESRIESSQFNLKTSYITHVYPPSVAALSTLSKVMITDLRLETNHRGKYVVLRTITPAGHMVSVMAIVEDENGICDLLTLYNCWDQRQDLQSYLGEGKVVLVKEPYYKRAADGRTSIRVDHPGDIVFLDEDVEEEVRLIPVKWRSRIRELGKTGLEWKAEGNVEFRKDRFYAAIKCYTNGIRCEVETQKNNSTQSPSLLHALLLNRAQAHLKLLHHELALKDATTVLSSEPQNEKALFRAARALYIARRWSDSLSMLQQLASVCKAKKADSKEGHQLTVAVKQRLLEEGEGRYNFGAMVKQIQVNGPSTLDVADYISPKIERRQTQDMGKGFFATGDIQVGELLMCQKAFELGFTKKVGLSILFNMQTEEMKLGSHAWLTETVVKRLFWNPEEASKVLELWAGDYAAVVRRDGPTIVDGRPVVDTFMIDRIRSLNCFGCKGLSSERLSPEEPTNPAEPKDDKFEDVGLWILPSFINHSCWGNVQRSFIGDVMIVRACAPIAAGEQITFSYAPLLSDNNRVLEERQKRLKRGWGFTCNCRYCTLERNERKAARNEREKLLQDVEKLYRDAPAAMHASSSQVRILLAALDAKIKAIEKTYSSSCPPATVFPRIHLAIAVVQKQNLCARYNSWDGTRLACEGVLKALGYEIDTSNNEVKITKYGYSDLLVLPVMWQLYICRKGDALDMGMPLNGKVVVKRVDTGGKGRAMDKLAEGWRRAAESMYEVDAGEKTTFEKVYALEKFIVIQIGEGGNR